MIFKTSDEVKVSNCDFETKLSIYGISCVLEDAFASYFGKIGFDGIEIRKTHNAIWVFSKLKIKYISNLNWSEKFDVTAKVVKKSPVKVIFEVALFKDNEVHAVGNIEACTLNLDKMTINKLSSIGDDNFEVCEPNEVLTFEQIPLINEEFMGEYKINSTNLDLSFHMNNAEYIKLALSLFTSKEQIENRISEFQINFLGQSFEGDTLKLYRKQIPDKSYIVNFVNKDKVVISCKVN